MAADQHPVEIIMARGMMTNLTTPAFLIDEAGNLIFFNEAAGEILGLHFEEAGVMGPEDWGTRFEPLSLEGEPLAVDELPLAISMAHGRPAHKHLRIRSITGEEQRIEVSSFPIVGRSGQRGSMAIFWGWQED
jgi:PAS domain-containing protein